MKMTMNIDEKLIAFVMESYSLKTKTEAVEFALRETARRHRIRSEFGTGLGLTREELANAVDPNYDLMALREADLPKNYKGGNDGWNGPD